MIKKQRLIVLFTTDVMCKRCAKSEKAGLRANRFVGKFFYIKVVEHKKFALIYYFGLPFRQRNASYKLQRVITVGCTEEDYRVL